MTPTDETSGIDAQTTSLQMLCQALVYPLRGHALPIIVVFALLFWMGSASITGIVATVIAISWPMKYAYHLLERSAHGHVEPPAMTVELVNPLSQQPVKHLILLFALFSLCYWVHSLFGAFVAGLLLAAGLALQPAIAAAIAMDDDMFAALDPQILSGVVRQLGRDYLLTAALLGASGLTIFWMAPYLPRVVWFAMLLYVVFATFHLLGLSLHRNRDRLGISADVAPERIDSEHRDAAHKKLNRLLDDVYRAASGHRSKDAIEMLLNALARDGDKLDDHAYVHEQTRQWQVTAVALRHGQVYVSRLFRGEQLAQAVDVYSQCQRLSDEFRVEEPRQALPLARCAQTLNKPFIGAHLLRNFEIRFPDHPDCGAVQRLRTQLEGP